MDFKSLREILSYIFVSVLAVSGAAFLALQFMGEVSSQEPGGVEVKLPRKGGQIFERPSFPAQEGETASSAREIEVFLEPFIYDSEQRRDPFATYKDPTFSSDGSGAQLGPLQQFNLDELELLGIMWDIRDPKAMFVDPAKKVHIVRRDEGIGKRNGYIAAIREGEVVVVEAIRTESGISYETKVIRLPR